MNCHGWILSVLADLKEYARANNLPKLSGMIEDARAIANEEIFDIDASNHKIIMVEVWRNAVR